MGETQHHISHLKPKSWFRSMAVLSVLVPGPTRVLALISVCGYFCSSRGFRRQGVPKRRHMCHETLPSGNGTTVPPAPGRPHNVHARRNPKHSYVRCLSESQRHLFRTQFPPVSSGLIIWLCSAPAHGPQSQTIKSLIYILPVSSHSK